MDNLKEIAKVGALGIIATLLLKRFMTAIRIIREEKSVESMQVMTIEEIQQDLHNSKSKKSCLLKLTPSYFQKRIIQKEIHYNQQHFLEPSDCLVVQKLKKDIEIDSQRKLRKKSNGKYYWYAVKQSNSIPPSINANSSSAVVKIDGMGKVISDIFEVKRQFIPVKHHSSRWRNIKQWFCQKLQNPSSQKYYAVASKIQRAPLFLGPLVGYLEYQIGLMPNLSFVAKCTIDDGKIIPNLTAFSKNQILDYYNKDIVKHYIQVGLLIIGALVIGRLILKDIKRFLNVLKVKKERKHQELNPIDVSDDKQCIICMKNCKNMLFFDCRHMIMCRQCSQYYKSEQCPVCKQQIDEIKMFYDHQ